jgi:uncharacterized glyoxalase superfamily metalloenzyme YdcJ
VSQRVETWQLQAQFASALSRMCGAEVPAYTSLVEVCAEVNRDHAFREEDGTNSDYSHQWMAGQIGHHIHDPYKLYEKVAT